MAKKKKPAAEDQATPVSADVADMAVGLVRAFLEAMHAYELRWLEIRPIQNYGISLLSEGKSGFGSYGWVGRRGDEKPLSRLQEVLWKEQPNRDEQRDALAETFEAGKYFQQAVAEKNEIWRQHLTEEDRVFANYFNQKYPPNYDPARLISPEVQQVNRRNLIVTYGEPEECPRGLPGRIRWHLRQVKGQWRIAGIETLDEGEPMKRNLS